MSGFSGFLRVIKRNEYVFISVVAVLIGILGGYGSVFFRWSIAFCQELFYGNAADFITFAASVPWWKKLFIPALAGLVVGPIVYFWAREAKGHGVPEVMEAVALKGGRIRPRVTVAKIVASAISIGAGGSIGREGPIVQIGAALGSTAGQALKVSQDQMRTLVGCGAAAGIAATFNAPIAGVIFALEILLGEFGVSTFSPIVLSSVTATAISRHYFGASPDFMLPAFEMVAPQEFLLYALLGVVVGLVGLAYVWTLYFTEDLFEKVPIPEYTKTILGGLLMGGILLVFPQTFGGGYGSIDMALGVHISALLMLLLVAAKILATSVTIGGGMSGGIFAPSLFIGAMAGGFFGSVAHTLLPNTTASPGAYALIGMGGMVAAATHAPITAILIIFELTGQYTLILPLMVTCIIATLLATHLRRGSIYTIKLLRRGVDLHRGRDQNIVRGLMVREVMRAQVNKVPEAAHLIDVIRNFKEQNISYLGVVNQADELTGIISFRDIRSVLQEPDLSHLVVAKDVATSPVITVQPEESIRAAFRKMGSVGVQQLPVVSQEDNKTLIGVIELKDINAAYNRMALEMESQMGRKAA